MRYANNLLASYVNEALKHHLYCHFSKTQNTISELNGLLCDIELRGNNTKLEISLLSDILESRKTIYKNRLAEVEGFENLAFKERRSIEKELYMLDKKCQNLDSEIDSLLNDLNELRETYRYHLTVRNSKASLLRELKGTLKL